MRLKHALPFGFGLVIALLFVACQSEIEPTIVTSVGELVTSTAASQSSLEAITSSPLPSVTSTVKAEATSNLVPDPSPSVTTIPATATLQPPSATPTIVEVTLTPLPTLEGEQLELAVAELLTAPMNCDVPCWWGAIPSITSLNEIKHFVSPYNFEIYEYEEDGEVVHLLLGIGYIEAQGDFEVRTVYNFSHTILTGITAFSSTISEILNKYGQPDEVWLETIAEEYQGSLPVRLNMVYLEMGIAVGYVVDGDHQDDVVTGCFADQEMGRLRLIAPNTAISYNDFLPIFEADRHYLLLEEATGLTMNEFMQDFSDPINPQCIETPAELWE